MGLNISQSMPLKPNCQRLMCIKLYSGHLEEQMTHPCPTFYLFPLVHDNFSICYYFCVLFIMSWERSLISCLPLIKWVLHKPKRTWATAATTKIIYSESTQQSDTSISSPAGDRENRGVGYKDHIAGKVGAIFNPTLALLIPQTRPFSPGTLPSSVPLKTEACFPLNKLLQPLVCL